MRFEYHDPHKLAFVGEGCRDNGDNDLEKSESHAEWNREKLTEDFPSPMFNCMTVFLPPLGLIMAFAMFI